MELTIHVFERIIILWMFKKFWSLLSLTVSQTFSMGWMESCGNLGSQWKCWQNLRQAALSRPCPSAISGSLWALRSESPCGFILRNVYKPIESVLSSPLLLTSGVDSLQGSRSVAYIYASMHEQYSKKKKKSFLNYSTGNDDPSSLFLLSHQENIRLHV